MLSVIRALTKRPHYEIADNPISGNRYDDPEGVVTEYYITLYYAMDDRRKLQTGGYVTPITHALTLQKMD